VQQLDAEPLIVVDVDDRPGAEANRGPVSLDAGTTASPDRRLESRALAEPERDVEEPQIADAVAIRPRTWSGIRV
jgi:hypothetical protein